MASLDVMPYSNAAALVLERGAAGTAAAAVIALVARRAGALSTSGAWATVVVGAAAVTAGWRWGVLLVLYFSAAVLLSRVGRTDKERRTGGVVAKGGARDATQVAANGGVFAACALVVAFGPPSFCVTMGLAALGALAASAADTWATEIGTQFGGTPRSVLTLRPLAAGTSGAISMLGSLAMIAGAAFVAFVARWMGVSDAVLVVALAGIGGALADSLLGATLQERRWCPACGVSSERAVHDCGVATTHAGGREWIDNDMVNLLSTFAGAAMAPLLANL